MSRIVKFEEYGAPEVLKIVDVDIPAPAAQEVRIKVRTIGLNRAESMWRKGVYVEPVNLPGRLGYEAAGIVEAIGDGVTHVAVGDEVSTMPAFSMNDYGVYGELVLVPAHAVIKKSPETSFEEAVSIWSSFVTPWGVFVENGTLTEKDTVLITAASSSVGIGAIQVAKLAGATVIALTRTSKKSQQLKEIGADHVIATDEQDLVAEVARITGDEGATFAFDAVGGPGFPKLVEAVSPGGTIIVYGALSDEVTPLPMIASIRRGINIRGYNLFGITTTPERRAKVAEYIQSNLAAGKLKTVIAETFPFDRIVDAHRKLEENEHIGRIVINV